MQRKSVPNYQSGNIYLRIVEGRRNKFLTASFFNENKKHFYNAFRIQYMECSCPHIFLQGIKAILTYYRRTTRGNLQVSSRSRRNKKVKPKKIGLEKWQLRPKRLKGTSIKFIIKLHWSVHQSLIGISPTFLVWNNQKINSSHILPIKIPNNSNSTTICIPVQI